MNFNEVDILYSKQQIYTRVKEMGQQISRDYQGRDLLVIGVLKGAFIFMADLIREINLPLELDFISVSSYGASTVSSGEVRITKDLDYSIEGKSVLIVEDIVDTGLTLKYIQEIFKQRRPESVNICCLLDKPSRRRSSVVPQYVGFTIDDYFIVGYGLDYAGKYRNYPAVCVLKPSVYKK
ncbi:MAG: hypoxanthine phosphoribosyltransferase [Syntrophomonadaceae bacterium]